MGRPFLPSKVKVSSQPDSEAQGGTILNLTVSKENLYFHKPVFLVKQKINCWYET